MPRSLPVGAPIDRLLPGGGLEDGKLHIEALLAEPDLSPDEVGDNEPYAGALPGDTIDAIATSRGLANALIEIRQDLIAETKDALAWAARIARLLRPILADGKKRAPADFGAAARSPARGRGKPSAAT